MPQRSRSSCEDWLAASIPSAFSLFLGHSALAETNTTLERLTTSGGRTTLGGQITPLDAGLTSVEAGVQVLLEGSVEYRAANGTCTLISSGTYSATSNPTHGMLSYGILDHVVQSPDSCNGVTLPYAVVYYTWTDTQSGATQDSFAVEWNTPDGMVGGPYPYSVTLSQGAGIAFNGRNITSTTQTAVVGQQIALTGSPTPSGTQSGYWQVLGDGENSENPVGGYTASPANYSTGQLVSLDFSKQTTTFYWTLPGTYTVVYQASQNGSSASAMFVVSAAPDAMVTVTPKTAAVPCEPHTYDYCDIGYADYKQLNGKTLRLLSLQFGAAKASNYGFRVNTVTSPGAGSFQWVQLINSDTSTKGHKSGVIRTCQSSAGLDLTFPYGPDGSGPGYATSDSPTVALLDYTNITRSFSATMYLMWTSNLQYSIPIPIGSVPWQFTESSQTDKAAYKGWDTPAISSSSGSFTDSSEFPKWENLATSDCKDLTQ